MRILVIGGTVFVGRHIVEAALARGHELTLFTRGQSNPEAFPGVEHVRGDRNVDLGLLAGRSFDAVVDTCAYVPRAVRESGRALADSVGRYLFISTTAVYPPTLDADLPESYRLDTTDDPTTEVVTNETYGPLKVLCEQELDAIFGDRATHLRLHYVVGPYDRPERFTYWPARMARGGTVLAPGHPDRAIQFVDGRDLAAFAVDALERDLSGPYNLAGPLPPATWGEFLETCREVTGSDAEIVWVDEEFLDEHGVASDSEAAMWVREAVYGPYTVAIDRALADGFRPRPMVDTVCDTYADNPSPTRAGFSPEREAELLAAWHARR
jgi:2'-hydroxyisoflavone reductase